MHVKQRNADRKYCSSGYYMQLMCFRVQVSAVGGPTQQQQIDSLLEEISDEVEIDARAAGIALPPHRLNSDTNTSADTSGLLQTNFFWSIVS